MAILNDAGKLNKRATFYKMVERETRRGTTEKKEEAQFTCWCTIRQARIREIQSSLGTEHVNKQTLIIRHQQRHKIKNDWTVSVNGVKFNIIAINPDYETQQYDMIVVEERY